MSDVKRLERALALVHAIYNRTREGKLEWEEYGPQDIFGSTFGDDYEIRIRSILNDDFRDEPDYELEIRRGSLEQTIETISNITLRPVSDKTTPDGLSPYAVLGEIYEMARRKALRVDESLESLLESLQSTD